MRPARPRSRTSLPVAARAAGALALASLLLGASSAHAYPSYDNGAGEGCVQCHNQFASGTGVLHTQHRTKFGITNCNVCHPSGSGTTPVLTYWSGPGGGYGCVGCHGQDYGETSPNSGEPKATGYGLRLAHVNAVPSPVPECGTGFCHAPGALGHPNPFPTPFPESVAPPYFDALFSNLTNPCSSAEEDLPFDADGVGLDNDGNGAADYPADPNCSPTPAPTPTPVFECGAAPAGGCIAPAKGLLLVNEKTAGKEKLKVVLKKLQATVSPADFGDPVGGSTAYKICIYDAADQLAGEYTVAQAGATCDGQPCFTEVSGKGYKYKDKSTTADGILKMTLVGGDPGKGKVIVVGKNGASTLPTGVAAALQGQAGGTVQLLTSDAFCFSTSLTNVKKADGVLFKALGP